MRVRSLLPVVILGAVLLPSEAWSQCKTASASGTPTHNTAFAAQTGTFTVTVDATPGAAAMDGGIGLSRGSQGFWSGAAAVVLFHPSGLIRARDASTYGAATSVPYTPGTSYRLRMVVNVPAHTYTVYVRPAGGSEVLLAQNYRFRPGQDTLTSLDNWIVRAEIGSVQACNFALAVPDTQAPSVAITSPSAGAVLSGTVTLSASASDNLGVTGVQFLLDGAATGAEDVTAPYALPLDTTSLAAGAHTVSARARDAAGNVTTAAAVGVTVNNATGGQTGSLVLRLTADGGAASSAIVSLGVPFAPGVLTSPSLLVVRDASGNEVPAYSASLATWPQDGSQRSVLVAFRATLASGQSATWRVDYGAARSLQAGVLAPNPDGPVSAQLAADWYSASRVIGYQVAAAKNTRFATWETRSEGALANMSPPWTSYGTNCSSTSQDRTYYDSPHAFFQRFIHRATASAYRRARQESTWYRANQLRWFSNNTVAIYTCTTTWNPNTALPWATLRRMLAQGMLDDYLLTGDPSALAALKGIGEAYRQNLPALTAGGATSTVRTTERNMAWPMMGLASYYAVQPTTQVRTSARPARDHHHGLAGRGHQRRLRARHRAPRPGRVRRRPARRVSVHDVAADRRTDGHLVPHRRLPHPGRRDARGRVVPRRRAHVRRRVLPVPVGLQRRRLRVGLELRGPEHPDLARLRRRLPRLGRCRLARLRRRDGAARRRQLLRRPSQAVDAVVADVHEVHRLSLAGTHAVGAIARSGPSPECAGEGRHPDLLGPTSRRSSPVSH
jgi:hypothetical protein